MDELEQHVMDYLSDRGGRGYFHGYGRDRYCENNYFEERSLAGYFRKKGLLGTNPDTSNMEMIKKLDGMTLKELKERFGPIKGAATKRDVVDRVRQMLLAKQRESDDDFFAKNFEKIIVKPLLSLQSKRIIQMVDVATMDKPSMVVGDFSYNSFFVFK